MRFRCTAAEGTERAARALAESVADDGLVLALIGPLGAGKTSFVKGLAAGLGLDPDAVSSPTFVIASQYPATDDGRPLAHVDLYRLESAEELDGIGFRDLLEPGSVVAVEWADRLPDAMPDDRVEIVISRDDAAEGGETSRSFSASATGRGSRDVLRAWQARLEDVSLVEIL